MTEALERLFTAADNHASDTGEPDHAVGDLQDLMRAMWEVLPHTQRVAFLTSSTVADVLEAGGRDEVAAPDLVRENEKALVAVEAVITAAGYALVTDDIDGYFDDAGFHRWLKTGQRGPYCDCREDAILSAYADLRRK